MIYDDPLTLTAEREREREGEREGEEEREGGEREREEEERERKEGRRELSSIIAMFFASILHKVVNLYIQNVNCFI